MSDPIAIISPMNELETQIKLARLALAMTEENEKQSGYEIEWTMERKYNEGFRDALEFAYILKHGHEFHDEEFDL